jgi:hypothetical protein
MGERISGLEDMLRRVQGEFLEMPGLRLTPAQARRLWSIDAAACQALLTTLVDAKFLFRTRDGAFMRVDGTEGGFTTHHDRAVAESRALFGPAS